jgi:phospholipid/cholesterol/gamma-HCH transport system permease protein
VVRAALPGRKLRGHIGPLQRGRGMTGATVTIERSGERSVVSVGGDLLISGIEALRRELASVAGPGDVVLELSGVKALDTAGAWALVDLRRRLAAEGVTARVEGASDVQAALLDTVEKNVPKELPPAAPRPGLIGWVASVGKATSDAVHIFVELLSLLGAIVATTGRMLVRPWRLRFTSLVFHMQEAGLNAVPIVALMAFLIGVVLAFQGATQLRQFGAEVFVVDLIAISVLRELGILLTAIIVAGRSASAFTAAIGSMKMREEIDAMRTLGLDPVEVLVLPRVLALILTLPLLGFIADMAGLIGGAAMSWIELNVSPGMFQVRLLDSTDPRHFLVGIIKAPFFALIIGLIGCYEGLKVEGNAESLGRNTSTSVVLAIFMVIVIDAVFSIFFAILGM